MFCLEASWACQDAVFSYLGSAAGVPSPEWTFATELNRRNKSSKFGPPGHGPPANGARSLSGGVVLLRQ